MIKPLINKFKPSLTDKERGNLWIPEDANIWYGEPAIRYQIKGKEGQKLPLFMRPPEHDKSDYTSHEQEEIEITEGRTQTVIKRKTNKGKEEQILAEILEESTEVLARPFEYPDPTNPDRMIKHPFLLQVTTFENIGIQPGEENRMDLGHEVRIKKLGYMYQSDLKPVEKFKPTKDTLFPERPQKKDIAQGGMGDCFFLSSLNAILAADENADSQFNGSELITSMMRQQDDGTTVVRFFDPHTLEPIYVRVENSQHYNADGDLTVNHRALWVHILEKAYAGLGYRHYADNKKYQALIGEKGKEQFVIHPASFLVAYGAGGDPSVTLTMLTGKRTQPVRIASPSNIKNPFNSDSRNIIVGGTVANLINNVLFTFEGRERKWKENLPPIPSIEDLSNHSPDALNNLATITALLKDTVRPVIDRLAASLKEAETTLYDIFSDNHELLIEWVVYLNILRNIPAYRSKYDEFVKIAEAKENNSRAYLAMIEKLKGFIPAPPQAVMDRLKEYMGAPIEKNNIKIYNVPGVMGSGQYTQAQYDLFNKLYELKQSGHLITAGTHNHFAENVPGLVDKHAYAITQVHTKKMPNGCDLLFIRVRNPWSHTGRVYEHAENSSDLIAKEVKEIGEFDLEINDFMNYFATCDAGKLPTAAELEEKFESEWQRYEAKQQLLSKPFKSLSTEEVNEFIKELSSMEISSSQVVVDKQGLHDIYLLDRELEKNIHHLKEQIKQIPQEHLKAALKGELARQEKLLTNIQSMFRKTLANSQMLPVIKEHAERYCHEHLQQKPGLVVKYLPDIIKTTFGINSLKSTSDYLNLYKHHLDFIQEEKKKALLLKDFSSLDEEQKSELLTLLLKEDDALQTQYFSTQSTHDLNALCGYLKKQSHSLDDRLILKIENRIKTLPIISDKIAKENRQSLKGILFAKPAEKKATLMQLQEKHDKFQAHH